MFSERLQILVSPEQRKRLEAEAERREVSLAAVVREAVDARLGGPTREQRLAAARKIATMPGGRFVGPDELNRIVAEERDAAFPPPR